VLEQAADGRSLARRHRGLDPATARVLGAVRGPIDAGEHDVGRVEPGRRSGDRRDADAGGDRRDHVERLDVLQDPRGDGGGIREAGVGEEDRELVAAEPRDDVVAADRLCRTSASCASSRSPAP